MSLRLRRQLGVLTLLAAPVNTVGDKDANNDNNQNRESDSDTKPCREQRAIAEHDASKALGTRDALEVFAFRTTCENGVGLSGALKLSAGVERRTGNRSAAVLTIALKSSNHLRDAIKLDVLGLCAEPLASDGIAVIAGGGVAIASAVTVALANDVLVWDSFQALLYVQITVEILLARIVMVASLIELDSPELCALSVIADAVDVAFVVAGAILADGLGSNALTLHAGKVHTALEVGAEN